MYNLTTEKKNSGESGDSFTEYSFEINDSIGFIEISDYLHCTKINGADIIKIKVKGQSIYDFAGNISSMINAPHAFNNFIKNCRNGVNGFGHNGRYHYAERYSIIDTSKEVGESLSINTGLNICFERIPNSYEIDLSNLNIIRDIVGKIEHSFIANSVTTGDTVTLKVGENKVCYGTQVIYYISIVQATNFVRSMYNMPEISTELPKSSFEEIEVEKCKLPSLLKKQTGINFSLVIA